MRISGEWLPDDHGVHEPILRVQLETGSGGWLACAFLLDTGAEKTLLAADVVEQLAVPTSPSVRQLVGLGGIVEALTVPTRLRFTLDDGGAAVVNGPFEGLPVGREGELSILGRDILGLFAVIVDRPGKVTCLLSGRHRYIIQES